MVNLLNFPYNLQDMMQDEEETLATDNFPHRNWTSKEQPNDSNEQIVENPPTPFSEHKTAPKSTKISA